MTPYYEQDGITIYHGDCREVIASMHAHLYDCDSIITDPVWPNNSIPEFADVNPRAVLTDTLAYCGWADRVAVHFGCDSDPRMLTAVPERLPFFRVCHLEIARVGYKGRLLMTGDAAYLFGTPPPSVKGAHVVPGRIMDPDSGGKQADHPCPRKVAHVQFLVRYWSLPRGTVLDPFMGSGTTLVAAKQLGRRAVGIEREERYCEIAAKRLAQGALPMEFSA
jgi:hypothetical protein